MSDSASGGYLAPSSDSPAEDDALARQLQAMVVGITGLPGAMVRPRWQPTPPAQPAITVDWAAIGVTRQRPVDHIGAIVHRSDADGGLGADELQRHEEIELLASFYGPNAQGFASRLRDGLSIGQNREALAAQDIAFVACGEIVHAPELVQTRWRRRADLAVTLRRQITRVYPVRNLTAAEGTIASETATASWTVEP